MISASVGFAIVVLLIVIAMASWFWIPIPLISYSQGDEEIIGRVTEISRLSGNLVEVALTSEGKIDPRFRQELTLVSCLLGSAVHFRSSAKLPKVNDIIVAQTTNRYYLLRRRSLNWVMSWNVTDHLLIGGRVTFKRQIPDGRMSWAFFQYLSGRLGLPVFLFLFC